MQDAARWNCPNLSALIDSKSSNGKGIVDALVRMKRAEAKLAKARATVGIEVHEDFDTAAAKIADTGLRTADLSLTSGGVFGAGLMTSLVGSNLDNPEVATRLGTVMTVGGVVGFAFTATQRFALRRMVNTIGHLQEARRDVETRIEAEFGGSPKAVEERARTYYLEASVIGPDNLARWAGVEAGSLGRTLS